MIIFDTISCPLYNLKIDFSMKLGTLVDHDETMCHFPLIIFHTISCPLYNSKIVRVISMKLGTLIKHDEITCRAKEP